VISHTLRRFTLIYRKLEVFDYSNGYILKYKIILIYKVDKLKITYRNIYIKSFHPYKDYLGQ
jgi:hypothetical protein